MLQPIRPVRRVLKTNEVAMADLEFMARRGKTDKQIQDFLFSKHDHRWDLSTIGKLRCGLGLKKREPTVKKTAPPFVCNGLVIYNSLEGTCVSSIIEGLQERDEDNMSFRDLCEYTISCYDRLYENPRKSAPDIWWKTMYSKLAHWNQMMEAEGEIDLTTFTNSQKRAYRWCKQFYETNKRGGTIPEYREIRDLYRGWLACIAKVLLAAGASK